MGGVQNRAAANLRWTPLNPSHYQLALELKNYSDLCTRTQFDYVST